MVCFVVIQSGKCAENQIVKHIYCRCVERMRSSHLHTTHFSCSIDWAPSIGNMRKESPALVLWNI